MPTRHAASLAALLIASAVAAAEKKPAPAKPTPEAAACATRVLTEARAALDITGKDATAKPEEAWKKLTTACADCGAKLSDATPRALLACNSAKAIDSEASAREQATSGLRRGSGAGAAGGGWGCDGPDCYRDNILDLGKRAGVGLRECGGGSCY